MDHAQLPACLREMKALADAANLDYIDVIINATLLEYPLIQRLAELDPAPLFTLLMENTPEHTMADQGPVLVRVIWTETVQVNWLGEFVHAFESQSRLLTLLSQWPFDALGNHLRYYTQAHWDQGARSGILRYYDTRLFKRISKIFTGDDAREFHAAVISWHWKDRDHKADSISGRPVNPQTFKRATNALMLDRYQMESLCACNAAEQWEARYGLLDARHRWGKELRITQLFQAHSEAQSKHLKGEALTAFVVEWLTQQLPENLMKMGRLL